MAFQVTQEMIDVFAAANAKMYYGGSEVTLGQTIGTGDNLEAIANSGYAFFTDSVSVKDGTNDRIYFSLASPPTKANYYLLSSRELFSPVFSVESVVFNPPAEYNFLIGQGDLNEFSEANAKLQINGVDAVLYSAVNSGDVLTAVANSGFAFYETASYPNSSVSLNSRDPGTGGSIQDAFTINDPPTTATITVGSQDYGISFSVATEQFTPQVSGSNNVYLIDNDILSQVNEQRFIVDNQEVVDYGEYILSVIKIPTSVDPELILETVPIQLGDQTITAQAPEISADTISIDMGEISVPATYGNSLDFQNTVCQLHLPYTTTVAIESYYVIGETIGIEYLLDVYTGNVTINLTSTKVNGEVFFTKKSSLGVNIPYSARVGYTNNVQNMSIDVGGNNHLTVAYMEVTRNDAPLSGGFFSVPIVDEDTIGSQNGYIEVDNVNLSFDALGMEKDEIQTMLSSGVIIQ